MAAPKEKKMARNFGRTRTTGIDKGARPGSAGNVGTLVGRKTGIADNTATSIIRVTVPSGNQNAGIELSLVAWLGTGTDQSESTRVAKGFIVLSRQAGSVDTVAAAATLALAQIATVSGGGTLTLAYGVSSISGANTTTQTFDIQVTLVKTGTITDLACMFEARLLNGQDVGVTIAAV
jgi:hypothetical protein